MSSAATASRTASASSSNQTIPPSDPSSGSTLTGTTNKSALGNFPLPAIVCVAIVGGVVFLYLVYRTYRYFWSWRQSRKSRGSLPSTSTVVDEKDSSGEKEKGNGKGSGLPWSTRSGNSSSINSQTFLSSERPTGAYQSNSISSLRSNGYPFNNGTGVGISRGGRFDSFSSIQTARNNSTIEGIDTSDSFWSVNGANPPVPAYIRGHPSISTDVLRAQGGSASRASLLANPRTSSLIPADASLPLNGPSSPHAHAHPHPHPHPPNTPTLPHSTSSRSSLVGTGHQLRPNRISGAPHARFSRIEIVTPRPLAPPPGTVVALDKTTLDFSDLSGMGRDVSMASLVRAHGVPSNPQLLNAAANSNANANAGPSTSAQASTTGHLTDSESLGASHWFSGQGEGEGEGSGSVTPLSGEAVSSESSEQNPSLSHSSPSASASPSASDSLSDPVSSPTSSSESLTAAPPRTLPPRLRHA